MTPQNDLPSARKHIYQPLRGRQLEDFPPFFPEMNELFCGGGFGHVWRSTKKNDCNHRARNRRALVHLFSVALVLQFDVDRNARTVFLRGTLTTSSSPPTRLPIISIANFADAPGPSRLSRHCDAEAMAAASPLSAVGYELYSSSKHLFWIDQLLGWGS